jgi:hypothetical protein
MEWRMVATPREGDKADIRQIVGRDRVCGRISATLLAALAAPWKPQALMSKGLQGF